MNVRSLQAVLALLLLLGAAPSIFAQSGQDDIRAAQQALRTRGYDVGLADGIVGPRTRTALEDFQRKNALTVTGAVDEPTLRALGVRKIEIPPALPPQPPRQEPPVVVPRPAELDAKPPAETPRPVSADRSAPTTDSASAKIPGKGMIGLAAALVVIAAVFAVWRRGRRLRLEGERLQSHAVQPALATVSIASIPIEPTQAVPPSHSPSQQRSARRHAGIQDVQLEKVVTPSPITPLPNDLPVTISIEATPAPRWDSSSYRIATPPIETPIEQAQLCWVPPGKSIKVAGRALHGGMLYVGVRLLRQNGYGDENCLINPNLVAVDPRGRVPEIPYYPSYVDLEPNARGAYLRWLASGRSDPTIGIGYVFLYFYGLERRLILDQASDEHDALVGEVRRLHEIYGSNYSFDRYARHLLDAAMVLEPSGKFYDEQAPRTRCDYEPPLSVRLAIGQLLVEGRAIPWNWMFGWVLNEPETTLRTAATRAAEEFEALFRLRFEAAFPDGYVLSPPKKRLQIHYRAASGSFFVDLGSRLGDMPDIGALSAATNRMREIVEGCADELDAYSRFLGRRPDGRGTLQAMGFLPPDLARTMSEGGEIGEVRLWLDALLANGHVLIESGELLRRMTGDAQVVCNKASVRSCREILAGFNVALMPDPRVSVGLPKSGQPFVLYRCQIEDMPETELANWRYAALSLTLAAFVAHADGSVSAGERRRLEQLAQSLAGIGERGHLDLKAYLEWLLAVPTQLGSLRSRVADLSAEDRHRLGFLALSAASADRHVDPKEIQSLQRIYKALGLDEADVIGDLHEAMAASSQPDEPVQITIGGDRPSGFAIPAPPRQSERQQVRLDPERLQQIGESTRRVGELLSKVFAEEGDTAEGDTLPADSLSVAGNCDAEEPLGVDAYGGLSAQYRGFLTELLTRADWPRGDLETLARSHELMTEGAIEAINEWAFDRYGDAILEDGDPVRVQAALLGPEAKVSHA